MIVCPHEVRRVLEEHRKMAAELVLALQTLDTREQCTTARRYADEAIRRVRLADIMVSAGQFGAAFDALTGRDKNHD